MKKLLIVLITLAGCSPKVQPPDPESLKPYWLKSSPQQSGYYTGIGHSTKDGTRNHIQAAKKGALDDLVSEIKVTVSSTSVLSLFESDKQFSEQYEQIIQTTVADEIEEFELVDVWEDATNYWVYYRLSIARYRQIKEEQRRNATLLATDFLQKARLAEQANERLQALSFYFQGFRSIEKYLDEAIRIPLDDKEVVLGNELYASIQNLLNKIELRTIPNQMAINRRVQQSEQAVLAFTNYRDLTQPAINLPLVAKFEKGSGDIFPTYKTNEVGETKILLNKIGSKELEQTVVVSVDIDALSGSGNSPVYALIAKTFNVPRAQVVLNVQRPVVYITSDERSLGSRRNNAQISTRLKNLLTSNGFEFSTNRDLADLWVDVNADSERGAISGSIHITYLTCVIKVTAVREGKGIYATSLDRIRGYGLDFEKSSIDAYSKSLEALEKEVVAEFINTVLQ